jgi:hypothetical protein
MRAPDVKQERELKAAGVKAILRVPFTAAGQACEFRCENRAPREPRFELHAAAELYAQLFALRLELDHATKN